MNSVLPFPAQNNGAASRTPARATILVVDDDSRIADLIASALAIDGHSVARAGSVDDALASLELMQPRLALIDLGLPDGNGLDLVRRLTAAAGCGVMVVSGQKTELDRILALELGADDFVAKPFSPRELRARVGALLRRLDGAAGPAVPALPPLAPVHSGVLEADGIVLDPARLRIVGRDLHDIRLTGAEAALLGLLLESRGAVVSRMEIGRRVLGAAPQPQQRGVDQLVSTLRRKLEQAGSTAVRIVGIRSAGYQLIV